MVRDVIIRRTEKFFSEAMGITVEESRNELLKLSPDERLVVLKLYRLRNLIRARKTLHTKRQHAMLSGRIAHKEG